MLLAGSTLRRPTVFGRSARQHAQLPPVALRQAVARDRQFARLGLTVMNCTVCSSSAGLEDSRYNIPVTTLTLLPFALLPYHRSLCSESKAPSSESSAAQLCTSTTPQESRLFARVLRTNFALASTKAVSPLLSEAAARIYAASAITVNSDQKPKFRPDRLPSTTLVHILLRRHLTLQSQKATRRNAPHKKTLFSDLLFDLFHSSQSGTPLDATTLRPQTRRTVATVLARTHFFPQFFAGKHTSAMPLHQDPQIHHLMHLPDELLYHIFWSETAVPLLHRSQTDEFVRLWIEFKLLYNRQRNSPSRHQLKELNRAMNRGMVYAFSSGGSTNTRDMMDALQRLLKAMEEQLFVNAITIRALAFCNKRTGSENLSGSRGQDLEWNILLERCRAALDIYTSPSEIKKLRWLLSTRQQAEATSIADALLLFVLHHHPSDAAPRIAHILATMHHLDLPRQCSTYTIILNHISNIASAGDATALADYAAAVFGLKQSLHSTSDLVLPPLPQQTLSFDSQATAAYIRHLVRSGSSGIATTLASSVPVSSRASAWRGRGTGSTKRYPPELYDALIHALAAAGRTDKAAKVWRAAVLNEEWVNTKQPKAHRWTLPIRTHAALLSAIEASISILARTQPPHALVLIKQRRTFALSVYERIWLKSESSNTEIPMKQEVARPNRYILRLLLSIFKERPPLVEQSRGWLHIACLMQAHSLQMSRAESARLHQQHLELLAPSAKGTPLWITVVCEALRTSMTSSSEVPAESQHRLQRALAQFLLAIRVGPHKDVAQVKYCLLNPASMGRRASKKMLSLLEAIYTESSGFKVSMDWDIVLRDLEKGGFKFPRQTAERQRATQLTLDW